ncbi:mannose-6-phosphate isomerase, class I [Rhodococcus aerolatus]
MDELRGAVRSYAWGSRHAIAELQGRPAPTPWPEAELWLGAHPADPAHLGGGESLLDVVAADPEHHLGGVVRAVFGDRLPFLAKVLAADEPLSLQAHPSAAQAAEGFAREQARGIPLGAAERNYKDDNHKPELVCALTEFHALAGFRAVPRTVALLDALDCTALAPHRALLADQPDAAGLRALFTTWITLPQPSLDALVPAVLDACVAHVRGHGDFAAEARTALELGEAYPGDAGVLASLLLNRVTLAPGEALYLPAGNLHAYLSGVGVEVMANSDNVLRGGLTPKHVDVPELLRVLDFDAADVPVVAPERDGDELVYRTGATEFELSRLDLAPGATARLDHSGPQVLLAVGGSGEAVAAGGSPAVALARGRAAWVPAGDAGVEVRAGEPGLALFRVVTPPG